MGDANGDAGELGEGSRARVRVGSLVRCMVWGWICLCLNLGSRSDVRASARLRFSLTIRPHGHQW